MVSVPKKIKDYKVSVDNKMKWYGETDIKHKTVKINVKKSLKAGGESELKDTIAHERLHVMNPQATEKEVQKKLEHKSDSLKETMLKGLI